MGIFQALLVLRRVAMGPCVSKLTGEKGPSMNPVEVDKTHFEVHTVIGKGQLREGGWLNLSESLGTVEGLMGGHTVCGHTHGPHTDENHRGDTHTHAWRTAGGFGIINTVEKLSEPREEGTGREGLEWGWSGKGMGRPRFAWPGTLNTHPHAFAEKGHRPGGG